MASVSTRDIWMLFERFKMALYDNSDHKDDDNKDNDKFAIKETLIATNGKTVKSSVVFIAAYKHLQEQAKKFLKRNELSKRLFRTQTHSEYQWIIAAIWNDAQNYK